MKARWSKSSQLLQRVAFLVCFRISNMFRKEKLENNSNGSKGFFQHRLFKQRTKHRTVRIFFHFNNIFDIATIRHSLMFVYALNFNNTVKYHSFQLTLLWARLNLPTIDNLFFERKRRKNKYSKKLLLQQLRWKRV